MKIFSFWVLLLFFSIAVLFPVLAMPVSDEQNLAFLATAIFPKDTPGDLDKDISLIFVGDIMLSRGIGRIISKKNDPTYPFRPLMDFLNGADITFGNLENPVSLRGRKVGSIYSFRADPIVVEGLQKSGFDVLTLANNHTWDYGKEAFLDTMDHLRLAKIDFIGGGLNYTEAHQPLIKKIKGAKIAFLGYTDLAPSFLANPKSRPAVAFPDKQALVTDIEKASGMADIVVVNFHWGEEYQTEHNSKQEALAKLAIDSGADLVVGHHPHVAQEIEPYEAGHIAYSLGNFVFDQNFSPETGRGLVLKVLVHDRKIEKVEPIEIGFNTTYQPFLIR